MLFDLNGLRFNLFFFEISRFYMLFWKLYGLVCYVLKFGFSLLLLKLKGFFFFFLINKKGLICYMP